MANNYSDTASGPVIVKRHWQKKSNAAAFLSLILSAEQKPPGLDTLVKLANALDISVDILLGKELNNYTSKKLKDIEGQLKMLPSLEQQKILDILESIVAVELDYHRERE